MAAVAAVAAAVAAVVSAVVAAVTAVAVVAAAAVAEVAAVESAVAAAEVAVTAVVATAGVSPAVASGPSQCCPTLACILWILCHTGGSPRARKGFEGKFLFCDLFCSFSAPFENPDRCEIYGFFVQRK